HAIVLIIEGTGRELFSKENPGKFNNAIYIKKMLEHNMENGSLPRDNLHQSTYRFYEDGQDIFMPVLKKSKDRIKINIEKDIGKTLYARSKTLIKTFKDLEVDPIGLGAKYKHHYQEFNLKS
ncbi:spore gernimation protein GerH, partial [Bacillus cereus]